MKLATFRRDGSERIGLVHSSDARLFDLAAAAARDGAANRAFDSMLALIDSDASGLDAARSLFAKRGAEADLSIDVSAAELLAPLPQPRQMRDCMSFATHIRQSGRGARALAALSKGGEAAFKAAMAEPLGELAPVYQKIPIYYITNRMIVRGPGTTVLWPRYSKVMDYELEFGIVTRGTRANIPLGEARDHIFGYTIFNDFSARDMQMVEMEGRLGPAKGKSFDGANVMGPWIVTPDEIGDPQTLKVEVRVNGEVRSRGETAAMLFSFEEILAHASQDETIHAGEFFGSGTVGNCCGLEIGRFLEHGDVIELQVENIGVLKNKVERQS
ncbi:fumarylacetoacetate hydrolase family protein [Methylocapsa sp. S129]|uniref:fumarylacetoacetate hydrolase family protein n=1 Tax=Methylocapsa sp. S129 TaxID=1641869 RepID=UPI00131B7EB4|nr:fumarylacetoacetate hydrolase family protein [Methylocapsa sp. S129]